VERRPPWGPASRSRRTSAGSSRGVSACRRAAGARRWA